MNWNLYLTVFRYNFRKVLLVPVGLLKKSRSSLSKVKKNTWLITARSLRAGMRTLALPENCQEPLINITLPCYPPLHLHYTNSTVSFYSTYVKLLIKLGAMDYILIDTLLWSHFNIPVQTICLW